MCDATRVLCCVMALTSTLVRDCLGWAHDLQVTEALTHGTISWAGKGERRTLLYKYAQSHVGYGNAPTVPADHSGVALTEEQRRLFVCEYCLAMIVVRAVCTPDRYSEGRSVPNGKTVCVRTTAPGKIHSTLQLGRVNPRALG